MNKENVIKDLNFILSKYESNLETELYPIEDSDTHKDLELFNTFLGEIINRKQESLENSEYSQSEYQTILFEVIQTIDQEEHFLNSNFEDQKKARQTISATSDEIKKAI